MIVILIVFFDEKSVVHSKFVPKEQTVNSILYVEMWKRLKLRVNQMLPENGAN